MRSDPVPPGDAVARSAVIILTLNAEAWMPRLLSALDQLPQAPARVLFVDSASTDGTVAMARAAGHRVHNIRRADFGHGRTRNVAAGLCTDCDYLVYLTQDACPQGEDWLAELLRPFADPQVALVYGRQLPRPEATFAERQARDFNYPATPDRSERGDLARRGIKAVFCSNSFAAYRRAALAAVGGFPEKLPMGEDMAAALRLLQAGHARVYHPAAAAVHSHDYTLVQEFKRYFDIGALLAIDPELMRVKLPASGEGLRFLKAELAEVLRNGRPLGVLAVLARTAAKSAGYALGLRHALLPVPMKRRLSMHSYYWRQS